MGNNLNLMYLLNVNVQNRYTSSKCVAHERKQRHTLRNIKFLHLHRLQFYGRNVHVYTIPYCILYLFRNFPQNIR